MPLYSVWQATVQALASRSDRSGPDVVRLFQGSRADRSSDRSEVLATRRGRLKPKPVLNGSQ